MANRNYTINKILNHCKYYDNLIERPKYISDWRYLIDFNNTKNICKKIQLAHVLYVPQRRNDEINGFWDLNRRIYDPTIIESFIDLSYNDSMYKYLFYFIIILLIIYINQN